MNVELNVNEADLESYLGRFVRVTLTDEHPLGHSTCGFVNSIRHGRIIFDDCEPVSLVHVLAAYNIVGKKIAGEGPDVYVDPRYSLEKENHGST